jgi:hypothetical protein
MAKSNGDPEPKRLLRSGEPDHLGVFMGAEKKEYCHLLKLHLKPFLCPSTTFKVVSEVKLAITASNVTVDPKRLLKERKLCVIL